MSKIANTEYPKNVNEARQNAINAFWGKSPSTFLANRLKRASTVPYVVSIGAAAVAVFGIVTSFVAAPLASTMLAIGAITTSNAFSSLHSLLSNAAKSNEKNKLACYDSHKLDMAIKTAKPGSDKHKELLEAKSFIDKAVKDFIAENPSLASYSPTIQDVRAKAADAFWNSPKKVQRANRLNRFKLISDISVLGLSLAGSAIPLLSSAPITAIIQGGVAFVACSATVYSQAISVNADTAEVNKALCLDPKALDKAIAKARPGSQKHKELIAAKESIDLAVKNFADEVPAKAKPALTTNEKTAPKPSITRQKAASQEPEVKNPGESVRKNLRKQSSQPVADRANATKRQQIPRSPRIT